MVKRTILIAAAVSGGVVIAGAAIAAVVVAGAVGSGSGAASGSGGDTSDTFVRASELSGFLLDEATIEDTAGAAFDLDQRDYDYAVIFPELGPSECLPVLGYAIDFSPAGARVERGRSHVEESYFSHEAIQFAPAAAASTRFDEVVTAFTTCTTIDSDLGGYAITLGGFEVTDGAIRSVAGTSTDSDGLGKMTVVALAGNVISTFTYQTDQGAIDPGTVAAFSAAVRAQAQAGLAAATSN